MSDLKMGTAEARFADIIWEREPITSGQIAKIGAEEFNWKKSTSHTVLRRLCERGLFKNEDGTVTSLISRRNTMLDTVSSMWRIPSVDLYPHSSLLSGHEKNSLMRRSTSSRRSLME